MQADTIRLAFTYLIALVVIVGGGVLLVVPSQVPPEQLLPFLTAMIGAVIAFVFNRESANAQARSTERAFTAGAAALTPTPTQPAQLQYPPEVAPAPAPGPIIYTDAPQTGG